jgi:hypothetical protein
MGGWAAWLEARQTLCTLYRGAPRSNRPAAEAILLTLSLRERADLTARQIRSEREQEETAQGLVGQGRCEIVVLSLVPRGAL